MQRHGSFKVTKGQLPGVNLAALNAAAAEADANSVASSITAATRDRDMLSQSTPAIKVSASKYPSILLYKTRNGTIMKYATLDDSIRSTAAHRSASMPTGINSNTSPLSKSDSAAMRNANSADVIQNVLHAAPEGKAADHDPDEAKQEVDAVKDAKLPRNRSVVFGQLEIREYARTIGCNPSVSAGPPVGLDWQYDPDHIKLDLEEYEETRGPRRSYAEMAMPRSVRQQILTEEWRISRPQIASAVREANRIKQSRRRTVNNMDTPLEKVEYQVEKARRNAARLMRGKKTVREEYEEWKAGIIAQWERWAAEKVIEDENAAAAAAAAMAEEEPAAKHSSASQDKEPATNTAGLVIDEDEASALNLSKHSVKDLDKSSTSKVSKDSGKSTIAVQRRGKKDMDSSRESGRNISESDFSAAKEDNPQKGTVISPNTAERMIQSLSFTNLNGLSTEKSLGYDEDFTNF